MDNFLEKTLFSFVDRSTTENDFNIYNIVQVHWLCWQMMKISDWQQKLRSRWNDCIVREHVVSHKEHVQ
jgi:hypothetical protein